MSDSKKNQINLLPQEEFASSTAGRILAWTLSTFRIIVIVTEVVVMGTFLSRFYLDVRISDLNEQIRIKTALIEASSTFENDFRDTQAKLRIVSTLLDDQANISPSITTIASLLPGDVNMTSYSYSSNNVTVRALTPSEFSISQLIANLESNTDFDSFDLSQVSTTDSGGQFNFVINLGSSSGNSEIGLGEEQ